MNRDDSSESGGWLDDFQEGSTTEAFMERLKKGMLLFSRDTPPEVIARGTLERFPPDD